MNLTAKLIQILPLQTGTSQRGEWKKQDIIVETQDQYPKKVCVSIWGDLIDQLQLKENEMYDIHFNLESREYNGRWYTDVRAWKVESKSGLQPSTETNDFVVDELDEEDFPF